MKTTRTIPMFLPFAVAVGCGAQAPDAAPGEDPPSSTITSTSVDVGGGNEGGTARVSPTVLPTTRAQAGPLERTPRRQRATADLGSIHPEYATFATYTQIYNSYLNACSYSQGPNQQVPWLSCTQSVVGGFFSIPYYPNNVTFGTDDYNFLQEDLGNNWILEESTRSYWNADSNHEFHWTSINSDCLTDDSNGIMDIGGCNGNSGSEKFTVNEWGLGSNPYPYVNGTIQSYYPSNTEYVLDVHGNNRNNGTLVDIAPYNGSSAQFWYLTWNSQYQGYEIQLTGSLPTMCLDKPSASNNNGTQLQIWQCNGQPQQVWVFTANQLVNVQSGTCLDAPLLQFLNNPYVQIWTCLGGMNQDWEVP